MKWWQFLWIVAAVYIAQIADRETCIALGVIYTVAGFAAMLKSK